MCKHSIVSDNLCSCTPSVCLYRQLNLNDIHQRRQNYTNTHHNTHHNIHHAFSLQLWRARAAVLSFTSSSWLQVCELPVDELERWITDKQERLSRKVWSGVASHQQVLAGQSRTDSDAATHHSKVNSSQDK